MVRPVTVGLNGSLESNAAADWAAREALRRERSLQLVYAWDWLPNTAPAIGALPEHQRGAEHMLSETAAALKERYPDLSITTRQFEDDPPTALSAAADEADLLVLGSRGLGGIRGFLVGSVALATVARVTRPVVLVRALEQGEDLSVAQRDVVLGLDVRDPSDALIGFAFDAAARRGANLRVLYAWSLPPIYGYNPGGLDPRLNADLGEAESQAFTETMRPWRAKFPGIEVTEQLVTGRAAHHLVDAAADADLLVVGRRIRRHAMGPHTGPVTHAVLHHAASPVAVVPHD
jgi:nucleotide-binding universal stress UspA family protein